MHNFPAGFRLSAHVTWTQLTLSSTRSLRCYPQLNAFTLCVFYSFVTLVVCCLFFFFTTTWRVMLWVCGVFKVLPSALEPYRTVRTTRYDLSKYHYVRVFARQSNGLIKLSASISAAAIAAMPCSTLWCRHSCHVYIQVTLGDVWKSWMEKCQFVF